MDLDSEQVLHTLKNSIRLVLEKRVSQVVKDRQMLSRLVNEFTKARNLGATDGKEVERLVAGSDEFASFLVERVIVPRTPPQSSVAPVSDAQRELNQIKGSVAWKVVSAATHFIDTKLFPPHTLRGRLWIKALFGKKSPDDDPSVLRVINKLQQEGTTQKVLAITYEVPRFDTYSGAHRFYSLLRMLAELGYSVTVLSNNEPAGPAYTEALSRLGIGTLVGQQNVRYFKEIGKYFDYVILHTPGTISYLDDVKAYCTKAKVIFDTSDLHYLRLEREGLTTGDYASLKKAQEYKEIELSLARRSDMVFVVSEKEKEILLNEVRDTHVEVIPNIHDIRPTTTPFAGRRDMVFIGSFAHRPNGDAVSYFLKEIFPLILEKRDIIFYVIGANPSRECLEYQGPNVVFTGHVPDVIPYFEKCRLMVAPLRYGAGVKGKLTQSMSLGLPFVTTSIGAEGMDLVDSHHCFVADDPGLFADRILSLYSDEGLWKRFRENGLSRASERYAYDAVKRKLVEVLSL